MTEKTPAAEPLGAYERTAPVPDGGGREAPTINLYPSPDPAKVRVMVKHPAFGAFGVALPLPAREVEVTDAMVERAYSVALGFVTTAGTSRSAIFSILTAALTEPPARPEGAEEIEAILSELPDTMLPATDAGRADLLASRGVRAPKDGAA